jgi:energy-coupling factor transporter transmembrane protein EcfT
VKLSYQKDRSWFHQIDPLSKAVWCLLITLWVISLRELGQVIWTSLSVLMVCILGARINLVRYLRLVMPVVLGALWLVLFQGLFRPGPGIDAWFVHLSYTGLTLGLALALRMFGFVASSLAFTTTIRPKRLFEKG